MLVVVHHGDVEGLLQTLLYIETLWSFDVFKVDAAEGGGNTLYGLTELLWVFLGHLDVKHVDAAIDLEEQAFSLHHRLAAHGSNVTKAQDRCSIRDDGDEVALVGIFVGVVRIFLESLSRGKPHLANRPD